MNKYSAKSILGEAPSTIVKTINSPLQLAALVVILLAGIVITLGGSLQNEYKIAALLLGATSLTFILWSVFSNHKDQTHAFINPPIQGNLPTPTKAVPEKTKQNPQQGESEHTTDKSIKRIFISCPMAGAESGKEYKKIRKDVKRVIEHLTVACKIPEVLWAGSTIASSQRFDTPQIALEKTIAELDKSDFFILIYPSPTPSSVIAEAGYALARKIPGIFFVKNDIEHLPYLLRGVSTTNNHMEIHKYSNHSNIKDTLSDRLKHNA